MSAKRALERVTARVFCHGPDGGNPVTIFSSQSPLSGALQEQLAKSCKWESVMVAPKENESKMAFYMPSGEEVSFCAHAALGGAFAIANAGAKDRVLFRRSISKDDDSTGIVLIKEVEGDGMIGTACLCMTAAFEESPVGHAPTLSRLLRGHLGVGSEQLVNRGRPYPTLVNASVARPKTLVHLNSLKALQQAKQPKVSTDPNQRNSFAAACAATDHSTGIYLYANRTNEYGAWECRQFPRASGYPEDPATGIAAASLACSLYKQGVYLPLYKFYQGITMQRPSLIEVSDLTIQSDIAKFTLRGRVEIEQRETIDIDAE